MEFQIPQWEWAIWGYLLTEKYQDFCYTVTVFHKEIITAATKCNAPDWPLSN